MNQNRLIANLFNYYISYLILIKFGLEVKWVKLVGFFSNVVSDYSGFSAAPAYIKLAVIIIINLSSKLQVFYMYDQKTIYSQMTILAYSWRLVLWEFTN